MFAIDDAAANDVMVFRTVRRSGLLYRIVSSLLFSSLAAVCFDCLLEVVWLATNALRLGFGTMARNHDSFAANVDDFDLDGTIDIGSTTTLEGEPYAPVCRISQFFYRAAGRGDQFRGDFQALYDEGIQVALKYLGE
jgi:hypothetical protein